MDVLAEAILIGAGCAVFARLLWSVAARIGRSRELAVGTVPAPTIALCAVASGTLSLHVSLASAIVLGGVFCGVAICAVVDARTGLIFDALSGATATIAALGATATGTFADGMAGAAGVGGALLALYAITRRRGIGLGDVKLAAAIGLGFGLERSLIAIGSAFVLGAVAAGALLLTGRARRTDAMRFGPYLAGGALAGMGAAALGVGA